MARLGVLSTILAVLSATTFAADNEYLINFDLNMKLPDGSDSYSVQLQGIGLRRNQAFHGSDLGKYDYYLTVSDVENGKGKLSIEFFEFETRMKTSEVVSQIVANVDFSLGSPAVFESMGDTFGIDLAFSIVEK
jgi:hypothetical protein